MDDTFPRSVLWSALRLQEALQLLERFHPGAPVQPARRAGWLAAQLRYLDDASLVFDAEDPSLSALIEAVASIADSVDTAYFARGAGPDLLASIPQQQQ